MAGNNPKREFNFPIFIITLRWDYFEKPCKKTVTLGKKPKKGIRRETKVTKPYGFLLVRLTDN